MATIGKHQRHQPTTIAMRWKVSALTGALLDVAVVGALIEQGRDLTAMGFIATPILTGVAAVCWHYAGDD